MKRAEDPRRRLGGRPRLPLRLHARVVAALEGAVRGRRRPDRHAVPRAAGRVALVAHRAEPDLPRGRDYARGARRRRPAQGRPLPAPRRGEPGRHPLDRLDARDDLALGDAALAAASRAARRARARRRRGVVFTVPMAHFRGIPTALRERFGVPVVFYDGDVPMSLPEFGGMDTGFNYYHGADPSRVRPRRLELGGRARAAARARRAPRRDRLLGRRPRVLRAAAGREGARRLLLRLRRQVPARVDGGDGRRAEPRARPSVDFALGGRDFQGDTGRARLLGDVPFNIFARAISAARVNLNITRRSHATVPGSSTCRPFELAAAGAAIVSNPHEGIERWFEPGGELLVVETRTRPSPRTATCSPTPARPRSSAAARASACSTSTPTRSARAAAARRSSGSASRWPASPERERAVAIVPARNEEGAIGA